MIPESNFFSQLDKIDWLIILAYLSITLLIGLYFRKKASSNISSYFISGRNLPWWLLGTSMVATTFAADTPLAVTGWVRTEGIWKNWFWWNYIFSHVFIVFVFSRLWRRAEVLTDNELIELRYSGKPAAFLRGFKAFYFSTIFNFIVIGWVVSAMSKVLGVFFGIDKVYAVIICLAIAFIYTMLSGLWGVVVTDFIQYIFALTGTILLAVIVINSDQIGGYSAFIEKLNNIDSSHLKLFITSCDSCDETGFFSSNLFIFLVFVTVVWWSSHNADGGGYFIQRFLSAKNEKHAVLGMAWFVLNHYIIRFWPWVVVAIASLIVFPTAEITSGDQEAVYVAMIREFLGPGLKGLLLVTFIAAFMSTISTQLNWGASYLLNDVYKRFMNKNGSDNHYVSISKLITFLLTIVSGFIAFQIKNIGDAWIFVWAMSSGIGLVLILRWFWWRINAWSEITALLSSLLSILIIIIYTRYMGY
ncbi:MAG: sodium:solute symporter family protein, partial [Thermodesulfobacteriota bacterium]